MYKSKTKPFEHQERALKLSAMKKNFAYFMEMGCVDGETEFLTQRGWVKFKDFALEDWERPLLVAQCEPYGTDIKRWSYRFVEPEAYIKKDSNDWYTLTRKLKSGEQKEFMFTGDHILPISYCYTNHTTNHYRNDVRHDMYDCTVRYLWQCLTKDPNRKPCYPMHDFRHTRLYFTDGISEGFRGFDSEYFYPENNKVCRLTPAEIKFMVAVAADGTYPNKNDNKVDFYFTKGRKVERIQQLAAKAGIQMAYETRKSTSKKTIHIFHAIAPIKCKVFGKEWYSLNKAQLRAVAEEVFHWDGYLSSKGDYAEFYTIHKESADFIQYALTANGWPCRIRFQKSKNLYRVNAARHSCCDLSLLPEEFSQIGCLQNIQKAFSGAEHDTETRTAYCFRVPSGYLLLRRDGEIFVSGNSGKTKVMLDNIGTLYDSGHITGAIILAPKGVYMNWSEKEIPTHMSDDIEKDVLVWKASDSEGKKRALAKRIQNWDGKSLQLLVYNIESLISEKGMVLLSDFIKQHKGKVLALVDESTCIKNHKAKRTKAAINVGKKCLARRIATGSPVTNSPLDLYSQCAFLDKSLLGFGSFYSFRNTYANIEKVRNRQGQSYDKILSYKNLDQLSKRLDEFSFRITKKECLDLPDKIYVTRDVDLTPEQVKLYKEMSEYQFAMLEKDDQIHEMSAQIVLTKLLRLHQLLCGTFVSDEGEVQSIPNNRIDALREILEETSGKVIIWATYRDNIFQIAKMLQDSYGDDSFVTYFGDTSPEERTQAISKFQDEESPVRFFLGNVQTAGRGITLTAASTVVYYSNNFSLELRQQSEDRAHRLGQKNKVTYIDLVVRHSLDEKIIKSLIEKRNIANEILKDDLENWISLSRD
jgi:hypothetical protein